MPLVLELGDELNDDLKKLNIDSDSDSDGLRGV